MPVSVPKNHMLHPGKILEEIYMKDHGYNQSSLAEAIGCTHKKINEIVNGKRGISPSFALQLSDLFSTTPELWIRLQADYDLFQEKKKQQKTAM